MVSRQTISLWETGQAMPTIDNLIRLKEIFGMPIDSIICDEHEDATEPKEAYSFIIDPLDLTKLQRAMFKRQIAPVKHFLIGALIICIPVLLADFVGFASGALLAMITVFATTLIKSNKALKSTIKEYYRRKESIFNYRLFDDHLICEIVRDGDVCQTTKIYFSKIDKMYYIGEYLAVCYRGVLYLMKTASIPETSRLYTIFPKDTSLSPAAFEASKRTVVSIYLILLSIASVFGGLWTIGLVSDALGSFVDYTWIFYLFIPVPISLICYGIYLKKKKYSGILNVVIGIIICLILALYGSFCFMF